MTEDVRWDLIRRIRREIAEGTYETQEKLEVAVDGLLSEMCLPAEEDDQG